MAESYRGLTIRIGGDTTKLTKALRAANQAASQTTAELRKIGQAVRLDPSNIEAYNTQLGYLSNQASNTAMKLHQLKEAQRQLEGTEIKVGMEFGENGLVPVKKTIQEIVDEARAADGLIEGEVLNVSQHFASANAVLKEVTSSLAEAHTEVTGLVASAAEIERLKLTEALNIAMGLKDAKKDADELREAFLKLPDGTERTDEQIDAIMAKVEEMAGRISGAFDLDTGVLDTEAFEDVVRQLSEEMPEGVSISEKAIKRLVKSFSAAAKEAEKVRDAAANSGESSVDVKALQDRRNEIDEQERQNQGELREAYKSTAQEAVDGLRRIADENERDQKLVEELKRSLSEAKPASSQEQADTAMSEEVAAATSELERLRDESKAAADSAAADMKRIEDATVKTATEIIGLTSEIESVKGMDAAAAMESATPDNIKALKDKADELFETVGKLGQQINENRALRSASNAEEKREVDELKAKLAELKKAHDEINSSFEARTAQGHSERDADAMQQELVQLREYADEIEVIENLIEEKEKERVSASRRSGAETKRLNSEMTEASEMAFKVEQSYRNAEIEDLLKYADASDAATDSAIADLMRLEEAHRSAQLGLTERVNGLDDFNLFAAMQNGYAKDGPDEYRQLIEDMRAEDESYDQQREALVKKAFAQETEVLDALRQKRAEANGLTIDGEARRMALIEQRTDLERQAEEQGAELARLQEQEANRQAEAAERIAEAERKVAEARKGSSGGDTSNLANLDEIAARVNEHVAKAQAEGENLVNEAIARGNSLVDEAISASNSHADAVDSQTEAQERLNQAHHEFEESLDEESRLYRALVAAENEVESVKSDKELFFDDDVQRAVEQMDEFVSAAQKAKEALRQALNPDDDNSADAIRAAREETKSLIESLQAELDSVRKASSENFKSRLDAVGDSEAYDALSKRGDELSERERELAAEVQEAWRRSYSLISAESVRSSEVQLENATKVREAVEQYWMQTGESFIHGVSDSPTFGIEESIENEIDAAKRLLGEYRDYYKDTLASLRSKLNAARKSGDTDLVSQIREEMSSFKDARSTIVSQLQSHISKLETELKNVRAVVDVTFDQELVDGTWTDINKDAGLDLYNTPIVKLYDTLREKLAETNELRDAEARKIEETTATLRDDGAAQDEITSATAESAEKMEQLDKRAALLAEHIAKVKAVGGQLFTDALSKAQVDRQADDEAMGRVRAEVQETYAARMEDAEDRLAEAREKHSAAQQRLIEAEQRVNEASSACADERVANEERILSVEDAQAQAAKIRADAEEAAAKRVSDAIGEVEDDIKRLSSTEPETELVSEKSVETARQIEEIEGRIAERQKQAGEIAASADEKLADTSRQMEESAKSAKDSISKIDEEIESAKSSSVDFGRVLVESFSDVDDKLGDLVSQVFNSASGNVDPEHIREVLKGIAEDAGLGDEQIDALVADIARLAEQFAQADTDYKKWLQVAEFEDLVNEVVRGEAQLTNFANVLSDIKVPSDLARGMSELTTNAQYLRETFGKLMSTGGSLTGAFKADPSNVEAIEAAMRAYSAAAVVAEEESSRLAEQIRAFEESGITHLEGGAKSAQQALFEAGKAAEEARRHFADLDGEYAHVTTRIAELESKRKKSITNSDEMEKAHKEDLALLKALNERKEELDGEREKARQEARDAGAAEELAKQHVEYEQLISDAAQLRSEVTRAREAAESAAQQKVAFELVGDTSEIDRLGAELDAAAKRAKALDEALKLDPKNTELAEAKTRAFADVASVAAKRTELIQAALKKLSPANVEKLRKEYGSVETAVRKTTAATTDYESKYRKAVDTLAGMLEDTPWKGMEQDVIKAGDAMESQLHPAIVAQRNEILRIADAWEQSKDAMREAVNASVVEDLTGKLAATETGKNVSTATKADEAAFQQAAQRMAQYAQQFGRHVVESANTIDSAYRDMRKTVKGTEEQFTSLRDTAVKFSQTNAVSADQILEMESLGGQLGVAIGQLQSFGEVASHLDIATNIGAEDIALQMGQLSNIMSDFSHDNFENFADSLVRLGNNMPTTESAIMEVAQRMAAVANVTSMTTPELLSWAAAIASTGQRSESAATAINNTITGIGAAVAKGGKTLEGFASIANMTSDDFKRAWEESSTDALKAFVIGLQGLTDDSTDAIAALDSVGISGVRQRTALLALSQTIQNLDKSLTMSTDAWNGVTDEWGTAGDAAHEANEKSKGFSGSLKILQNNAANLAASFGESLVPFLNLASSALNVLTDILNLLPTPLKSVLAALTALTASVGVLAPAVSKFVQGWKEMIASGLNVSSVLAKIGVDVKGLSTASGDATGALASLITSLQGVIGAEVATTTATKVLEVALNALPIIGWIAAAVTAFNMFTGMVGDAISHIQLLNDATTSLRDTQQIIANSYLSTTVENMSSNVIRSLDDMKDAHKTALESIVQFGDKVEESMTNVGANAAMADHYAQTIKELGNQGNITREQLAKLKAAVDGYNEITGAAVSITDEQTGALNILTPAIDEVTEAYKRRAEAEAYQELLKDAIKQRIQNEKDLAKATEELDKLEKQFGIDLGNGYTFMLAYVDEARELASTKEDLTATGEDLNNTIDDLSGHIADTSREFNNYGTALVAAGQDTDEFSGCTDAEQAKLNEIQAALASAGDSLVNYGSLNTSQLRQIIAAWDGSVPSIQKALKAMQASMSDAAASKPDDSAVRAFKNEQEAAYTAAKREVDDYYNSEKAARDKAYNDEKRRLDNEYDSLKKSLDKAYDARKSELDQEYNAAKSASDKYLKNFKESQDEAVKAFKAATDSRLAELKREYEYKKKLIEDEEAADTSDVDERIAALKAETQAEKDAEEQRKRQEKVDELVDAVNRAKTARKKAEAQKALDEYLAELETENRQRRREDMIDALEEEKDAIKAHADDRQQVLKDSYDKAVEEYKASREKQLEILQKANEAEYEAEKEKESAKLESIKSANDAELQSIKDNNEQILKSRKDANDQALEDMKAAHEAELLQIKRDGEDKLALLKNQQEEQMALYKETGKKTKDAAKEAATAIDAIAQQMHPKLSNMPKSMGDSVEQGVRLMHSVATAAALPLGTAMSAMVDSMTNPLTLLPMINESYGKAGASGLANGFNDANAVAAVQYAAEQLVKAGTDPAKVMEILNEQYGEGSAWALAKGYSNQQATDEVAKVAKRIVDANGDVMKVMEILNEQYGSNAVIGLANGLSKGSDKPAGVFELILNSVNKAMESNDKNMDTSGWNQIINYANGMSKAERTAVDTAFRIAQSIAMYFHHSTPDKGPLRGDDKWGGEMVQNYVTSMMSMLPRLRSGSEELAAAVERGFSPSIGQDVAGQIVDGMREQESRLLRQAKRMADIVERGFDPKLTVDAAYEAMDRISAGNARRQRAIMAPVREQPEQVAPVINVTNNFAGMTVRDDADIDRLSAEFERRMRRIIKSQIG